MVRTEGRGVTANSSRRHWMFWAPQRSPALYSSSRMSCTASPTSGERACGEPWGRRERSLAQSGPPPAARAAHLYTHRTERLSEAAILVALSLWRKRRTAIPR